jgi:O-antigen ligase
MNTTSSNRVKLARFDLEIFEENPVLGVGPGRAQAIRGEMGHLSAAHTEYTRMLAEHGILGLISIVLLFVMGMRAVLATRTLVARAFTVSMMTWCMLFLLVNAMRLSAPAFLFGLACSIAYSSVPVRRKSVLEPAKS